MAYILKPSTKLTIDPNQKIWGVNNHQPLRNIDSAAGDLVLPTQQGGIADQIRDKADQILKDKIEDLERVTDDTSNPYTDQNGTQTDSSSLSDTSQTIDDLNNYIDNLGGQLSNWKEFYDLMQRIYIQTGSNDFVSGDSARLAITEKIADMVYNFTSTLYSNAFQSQMWYEQQEYNSPLQQLHRLADAGLLGMSSQISTGNAQSAANTTSLSPAESSDAAALQQQAKQARMERIMQGIGLSLEFASLGMSGFQAATDYGVKAAQKELIQTQSANLKAFQIPQLLNLVANTAKTENDIIVNRAMAGFKGFEVANSIQNTANTYDIALKDLDLRSQGLVQEAELTREGFRNQLSIAAQNNAAAIKIAQMNNDKAEELANNFEWVEDGYFMYTGENQSSGRWVSAEEVTDMMEKTANGDFSVGSKTLGMDLGLSGSLKGTDVLKQLRNSELGESVKIGNTTFVRRSMTKRMTLKEAERRQMKSALADKHNLGPFPSTHTNSVSNQIFLHNQDNLNRTNAKVIGHKVTSNIIKSMQLQESTPDMMR